MCSTAQRATMAKTIVAQRKTQGGTPAQKAGMGGGAGGKFGARMASAYSRMVQGKP